MPIRSLLLQFFLLIGLIFSSCRSYADSNYGYFHIKIKDNFNSSWKIIYENLKFSGYIHMRIYLTDEQKSAIKNKSEECLVKYQVDSHYVMSEKWIYTIFPTGDPSILVLSLNPVDIIKNGVIDSSKNSLYYLLKYLYKNNGRKLKLEVVIANSISIQAIYDISEFSDLINYLSANNVFG